MAAAWSCIVSVMKMTCQAWKDSRGLGVGPFSAGLECDCLDSNSSVDEKNQRFTVAALHGEPGPVHFFSRMFKYCVYIYHASNTLNCSSDFE